jgi:hypothetical protein
MTGPRFPERANVFLFFTHSTTAPCTQRVAQSQFAADFFLRYRTEVKKAWTYTYFIHSFNHLFSIAKIQQVATEHVIQ